MPQTVRVGIIGAGAFTVSRLLPGFQKVPDCEVTMVVNRNRANAEKVAEQFSIPQVADEWREVINSSDVDAVLIGTPPNIHKEIALAALDAGKHVLCQTRIAISAAEALEMHEAAEAALARGVVTMLIPPSPYSRGRRYVKHLIDSGYLGKLRQVLAFNMNASFADPSTPLTTGRNDLALYGPYNTGQLGLTYDAIAPWTGHATRVLAQRATYTSERPLTAGGPLAKAPYPEEVLAIAETESGAVALNHFNWSVYFAEGRVELYGDKGTVVYKQRGDKIFGAQAGEEQLQELTIPSEYDQGWRVEEEFIELIRGEAKAPSFSFWDGVKNMAYLEAVYHSGAQGGWVDIM
jgi:predicted dehydrogenase